MTIFGSKEVEGIVAQILKKDYSKISLFYIPWKDNDGRVCIQDFIHGYEKMIKLSAIKAISADELQVIQACANLYNIFSELMRWNPQINSLKKEYKKQREHLRELSYHCNANFIIETTTEDVLRTPPDRVFNTLDKDLLQQMVQWHVASLTQCEAERLAAELASESLPEPSSGRRDHAEPSLKHWDEMHACLTRLINILDELKSELDPISVLYESVQENHKIAIEKYEALGI